MGLGLYTRDEWVSLEMGVQTKLPNDQRLSAPKQCSEDHESEYLGMMIKNMQISEPLLNQNLWGWILNNLLGDGSANVFCKGLDDRYF